MKTINSFFYVSCLASIILSGSAQAFEIYNMTDQPIVATGKAGAPPAYIDRFDFGTIPSGKMSKSWLVDTIQIPAYVKIGWVGVSDTTTATVSCKHGYILVQGQCGFQNGKCTSGNVYPAVSPDQDSSDCD